MSHMRSVLKLISRRKRVLDALQAMTCPSRWISRPSMVRAHAISLALTFSRMWSHGCVLSKGGFFYPRLSHVCVDATITKIGRLRRNCFAAVFEKYFAIQQVRLSHASLCHDKFIFCCGCGNLEGSVTLFQLEPRLTRQAGGAGGEKPAVINYRKNEAIYVSAMKDRVTVVFSVLFQDDDDIILGKVFLQVRPRPWSPHRTTPHRTAPHRTAPHRTAPHRTAPHHTAPHRTAPHHMDLGSGALLVLRGLRDMPVCTKPFQALLLMHDPGVQGGPAGKPAGPASAVQPQGPAAGAARRRGRGAQPLHRRQRRLRHLWCGPGFARLVLGCPGLPARCVRKLRRALRVV
jgi:hypothetical protein